MTSASYILNIDACALQVTHALQCSINHKPVIDRFATSGFVVTMNFFMGLLLARILFYMALREKFYCPPRYIPPPRLRRICVYLAYQRSELSKTNHRRAVADLA